MRTILSTIAYDLMLPLDGRARPRPWAAAARIATSQRRPFHARRALPPFLSIQAPALQPWGRSCVLARQACTLMQRDLHSKDSALVEPADAPGGHLASLYLRWRIPVMRMLRRHFGTTAEVEDAAQEVFVRVAATGKVLRPEEEQPYLRQTLRSVAARDWHKSAQSQGLHAVAYEDCEDELRAVDGDDGAAQHQRLTRLHQAVQELPQRQRQAFVLHRVEGHTVQETADRMGISLRMAVKHLARAVAYCETRVLFASAEQMQRLQAMQASLSEKDDDECAASCAQGERE